VVGLGDGLDDRQAEAGPADFPVSMRVDAGEPVEDPPQLRSGDAIARVRHAKHDRCTFQAGAQLNAAVDVGVRNGVFDQRIQC
jgi:hypothetical protein